jgi:hypothetical protein
MWKLWFVLLVAAPVGAAEFCGQVVERAQQTKTVMDNKDFPWIIGQTSWKAETALNKVQGCYCVTGTLGNPKDQRGLIWLSEVTAVKQQKTCAKPNMRAFLAPSVKKLEKGIRALAAARGSKP